MDVNILANPLPKSMPGCPCRLWLSGPRLWTLCALSKADVCFQVYQMFEPFGFWEMCGYRAACPNRKVLKLSLLIPFLISQHSTSWSTWEWCSPTPSSSPLGPCSACPAMQVRVTPQINTNAAEIFHAHSITSRFRPVGGRVSGSVPFLPSLTSHIFY